LGIINPREQWSLGVETNSRVGGGGWLSGRFVEIARSIRIGKKNAEEDYSLSKVRFKKIFGCGGLLGKTKTGALFSVGRRTGK